ncbi:hypothetical protein QAD02_007098, partial [Eretmocerus hayati]
FELNRWRSRGDDHMKNQVICIFYFFFILLGLSSSVHSLVNINYWHIISSTEEKFVILVPADNEYSKFWTLLALNNQGHCLISTNMENQSHQQLAPNYQSFWRKNSQAVPGRPSLKQEPSVPPGNTMGGPGISGSASSGSTSFQDFQESIDDAWDSGDDEYCVVSDVRISKKVSHSAALSVINHHRSSSMSNVPLQIVSKKANSQGVIPEEKKTEALQRLAVQPWHLKNANTSSALRNHPHVKKDREMILGSCSQRHTLVPGRPQPSRQLNSSAKCFIPSKEP